MDETPARAGTRAPLVIGLLALLGVAVLLALWQLRGDRDPAPPSGAGPSSSPSPLPTATRTLEPPPTEWDGRVLDLVSFVEAERGLTFEHPVWVDFLEPEEFRRLVRTDAAELSAEDEEDIEHAAALLRALGLIGGDVDLFSSVNDLFGEGVLAFYDPEEQRIRVRGTAATPGVRSTLTHELTHVLQDQHFGLEREFQDDARTELFNALVEGDASRIESTWIDQLSGSLRAAVDAERKSEEASFDPDAFPAVLVALVSAPYAFGEALVEVILSADGQEGLDAAFRDPPASAEQVYDPFVYLDGEAPVTVPEPALEPGESRLDGGSFGALAWFVVLAQHLDDVEVLTAVDGWGGDAYVTFDRADQVCVRIAWVGDSAQDAAEMRAAVGAWAQTQQAGAASVVDQDDGLLLEACDPGIGSRIQDRDAGELLIRPLTRAVVAAGLFRSGAPAEFTRCYAHRTATTLTIDELRTEDLDQELAVKLELIAQGCS